VAPDVHPRQLHPPAPVSLERQGASVFHTLSSRPPVQLRAAASPTSEPAHVNS
jgi:hypothetical protein